MFNQDALFKGYKKRLEALPKAKPGSEAARMVSWTGVVWPANARWYEIHLSIFYIVDIAFNAIKHHHLSFGPKTLVMCFRDWEARFALLSCGVCVPCLGLCWP